MEARRESGRKEGLDVTLVSGQWSVRLVQPVELVALLTGCLVRHAGPQLTNRRPLTAIVMCCNIIIDMSSARTGRSIHCNTAASLMSWPSIPAVDGTWIHSRGGPLYTAE